MSGIITWLTDIKTRKAFKLLKKDAKARGSFGSKKLRLGHLPDRCHCQDILAKDLGDGLCPLSITCRTMKLIFIAVVPGPEGPCGNKGKPTRQFSIQVGEEGKNLIINYLFFQYTCSAFPHQLPDTRKSPKSDS